MPQEGKNRETEGYATPRRKPTSYIVQGVGNLVTHVLLESHEIWKQNGNTTQPLGVTSYSLLKFVFRRERVPLIKSRTRTTSYNLTEFFNNAHIRVVTIIISDCKSTRIYTINSNIFTDDDFITSDLPNLRNRRKNRNDRRQWISNRRSRQLYQPFFKRMEYTIPSPNMKLSY